MAATVVSASTGVISTLLPKLTMLIQGEYKLQKGVKRKIAFLKDELTSMQTLLVKLANNEERLDDQAKDWRNKMHELSYDIEDCIDLFMHKMSTTSGAEANLVKKTANKIKKIWSRHKIGKLIEELESRVKEESDRRSRYKFDEPSTDLVVQIDPRLPALFVEAKKLVGIDGPREQIIEWLEVNTENQLKVVSIVGFGGLGKTTLANQVYQKIKGQFDCSCFVPVSRNPNLAKILTDMLKELGSDIDSTDDERQLIEKLRAFLQNKRYFIVVDDIWRTQAWELLKSAIPENNLNSRIITTTRIDSVAESCCSNLKGYVHKIKPLSDQQSHQLFFKRVFGDASVCPPNLEEMSHRILKKCHGLPLAIITIASLLAGKSNKDQWEKVCNSMRSAFSHQGMREILLLSYYDLPHHLKTCFLYLSMYPEDYLIVRKELVLRWIAEGFITEVRGQSADQVAESYFNELVNRSLIQPVCLKYDQAAACQVHDMVLDLIVSLSEDGNFASIVEGQNYKVGGHKIRRLSVQSEHMGDEVMQEIMDKWSQVRSISFCGLKDQGILHLQELYSLRVLVFDYNSHLGNQHIKHIGSFSRLTFLRISCGELTELPKDIGDLCYLQTLDIMGSGIRKLPPSVGRLQKLVCLFVPETVEFPDDEIGDLQALQEFSRAYDNHSIKFLESLRRLTKLKRLDISMPRRRQLGYDTERYEEAFKSSLAAMGKHGLQSLHISIGDILEEELMDILCCSTPCLQELVVCGSRITRLSKQMVSLANLTHLDLFMERIKHEDLCILGGIPALLFLYLAVEHNPDEQLTIRSQQFQRLTEFRFTILLPQGGLEMLFLQEAMPELRFLNLRFKLKETESKMGFAFSFEHLASLEHIIVTIDSHYTTMSRTEAAEAAIRNAVSIHPGRPTFDLKVEGPCRRARRKFRTRNGRDSRGASVAE